MSTSITPPPNPRLKGQGLKWAGVCLAPRPHTRLTSPFSKKDFDMSLGREGFFPTLQQEQAVQIVYRFVVGEKRVVHGCFEEFRK